MKPLFRHWIIAAILPGLVAALLIAPVLISATDTPARAAELVAPEPDPEPEVPAPDAVVDEEAPVPDEDKPVEDADKPDEDKPVEDVDKPDDDSAATTIADEDNSSDETETSADFWKESAKYKAWLAGLSPAVRNETVASKLKEAFAKSKQAEAQLEKKVGQPTNKSAGSTSALPTYCKDMQQKLEQQLGSLKQMSSRTIVATLKPSIDAMHTYHPPWDDYQSDWDADELCTAAAWGNKDTGFVSANCNAVSDSIYRRGEAFSFCTKTFECEKSGRMSITINFDALMAFESGAIGFSNYNNEANARVFGYICHPNSNVWKEDKKEYCLAVPPPIKQYGTLGGLSTLTLVMPTVNVSQGDPIEIGAGVRQYSRARFAGAAIGNSSAVVSAIQVSIN